MIQDLEGIRIHPSPQSDFGIEQVLSGGERTCKVPVYVNGNRTAPHSTGRRVTLDEVFSPREIDGLEFHDAPDGPIFEEDGCGSLLLWSEGLRMPGDRVFYGGIEGRVLGSSPDSAVRIQLEPVSQERSLAPGGNFSFLDLLPGEYELVVFAESGPIARLKLRVFAFRRSRVDLEIGRHPETLLPLPQVTNGRPRN